MGWSGNGGREEGSGSPGAGRGAPSQRTRESGQMALRKGYGCCQQRGSLHTPGVAEGGQKGKE